MDQHLGLSTRWKKRFWVACFLFLSLAAGQGASAGASKPILFVFDLDDTLIRWIRPEEKMGSGPILPVKGDILGNRYRVVDGAPEILKSLLDQAPPGSQVAFFSAAKRERNLKVLKELKLPDGRSALDVAYRVLSWEELDLLPPNQRGVGIFQDREKKNLEKMAGPKFDMEHILLVDDTLKRAYPGQESNVLWISPKPELHQVALTDGAQGPEKFFQDRNKLVWARGMIDRALELAEEKGLTPRQALAEIQWKGTGPADWRFKEELRKDLSFYRRGARLLHEASAEYRFTPLGVETRFRECGARFSGISRVSGH